MKITTKIITTVLAGALVLGSLAGCSGAQSNDALYKDCKKAILNFFDKLEKDPSSFSDYEDLSEEEAMMKAFGSKGKKCDKLFEDHPEYEDKLDNDEEVSKRAEEVLTKALSLAE